jgi:hypothetical protein
VRETPLLEAQKYGWVVEELRENEIRSGVDFLLEVLQVSEIYILAD